LASKIRRRSGNAFCQYLTLIGWQPNFVVMAGVGGANHDETAVMRESWGTDFELYGFEPSPEAYRCAHKTFPGRLWPHGLWSRICTQPLHIKPRWMDGSSMFATEDQAARKTVEVSCVTLDEFFAVNFTGEHGALWLDCEGAELEALKGANKFIDKVDAINVELTSVGRLGGWCSPRAVHDLLDDYGFKAAYIHSIRPWSGQRDTIYLRNTLYDQHPELVHIF
jgi:FkbM family methyltransferase